MKCSIAGMLHVAASLLLLPPVPPTTSRMERNQERASQQYHAGRTPSNDQVTLLCEPAYHEQSNAGAAPSSQCWSYQGVDLPLWLLQCICEQQEACKLYRLHTKPHDPEMIHSLTETTAFCFPCRNRFAHTLKLKKLVVASTNKHHFLLSVITLIITFSTAADSDLACSPSNSGWEPVS